MTKRSRLNEAQKETMRQLHDILNEIKVMHIARQYALTWKQTMALSGIKSSVDKFVRNCRYQDEYEVMLKLINQMKSVWTGQALQQPVTVRLENGKTVSIGYDQIAGVMKKLHEVEPIRSLIEKVFSVVQ